VTCYLALFVDDIFRMEGAVDIAVDDGVEVIGKVNVFIWGFTGVDYFCCCKSIALSEGTCMLTDERHT